MDVDIIPEHHVNVIRNIFLPPELPSREHPVVFAMAGIPGAGKSTFVEKAMAEGCFPRGAFVLDPDRVMIALPEYRRDMKDIGPERAFAKWQLPARLLAYRLAEEAIARRVDIVKDMGCARQENLELLKRMKKRGYKLVMHYVHTNMEEAIRRTNTRERYTPEDLIRDRLMSLAQLLPAYQELSDEFYLLDNSDLSQPYRPLEELEPAAIEEHTGEAG